MNNLKDKINISQFSINTPLLLNNKLLQKNHSIINNTQSITKTLVITFKLSTVSTTLINHNINNPINTLKNTLNNTKSNLTLKYSLISKNLKASIDSNHPKSSIQTQSQNLIDLHPYLLHNFIF